MVNLLFWLLIVANVGMWARLLYGPMSRLFPPPQPDIEETEEPLIVNLRCKCAVLFLRMPDGYDIEMLSRAWENRDNEFSVFRGSENMMLYEPRVKDEEMEVWE